jgi:hypothetical protein
MIVMAMIIDYTLLDGGIKYEFIGCGVLCCVASMLMSSKHHIESNY